MSRSSHGPRTLSSPLTLLPALLWTVTSGACGGLHDDVSTLGTLSLGQGASGHDSDSGDDTDDGDSDSDGDDSSSISGGETDGGSGTGDGSDGSTTSPGVSQCGNALVEDGEACDDGNGDNTDDCLNNCQLPICGDGHVQKDVEECDDGDADNSDECTELCALATCGDGFRQSGVEDCDDGNSENNDDCLNTCVEAYCGDGFLNALAGEVCDDGLNDNDYGSCAYDCMSKMEHCGDKLVQPDHGEMCDTNTPTVEVPCNVNCDFDFSSVQQLYCFGTCSWGGALGCDQADADIFCKLLTGDPDSEATDFEIVEALDTSGLACANPSVKPLNPDDPPMPGDLDWEDPRIDLGGPFEEWDVWLPHVYFIEYSMLETHGPNTVILPPTCTSPP